MNHRKFGKKLGRNTKERQALFKSLAKSIFTYGVIETTQTKAKAVIPTIEKLASIIMTKDILISQRELSRYFQDRNLVKNIYSTFKSVFGDQTSNFTKFWNVKFRQGDNALIVKLAFIKPYSLNTKKEDTKSDDKKKPANKETVMKKLTKVIKKK